MLKLLKNKNVKIKTKIAIVISLIAAICAVINLFLGDENLRIIIWALIICVWAIDYIMIVYMRKLKWNTEKLLKRISNSITALIKKYHIK